MLTAFSNKRKLRPGQLTLCISGAGCSCQCPFYAFVNCCPHDDILNTSLRSVSAAFLYTNYQATTKGSLIERVLVKRLRYENSLVAQLLMTLLIKSTACWRITQAHNLSTNNLDKTTSFCLRPRGTSYILNILAHHALFQSARPKCLLHSPTNESYDLGN